jgi:hypothetical protein
MQFYTDTTLGPTQSTTPEGYLIAKDTVIARCGRQIYHQSEVPDVVANADGWVNVDRDEGEVFHPAALASLAGKPIIDEHVDEIGPDNWTEHAIGFISDPRRGTGANADAVIADLVFTTQRGIDLVRGGKRAVSVGYLANYDQTRPGYAQQRDIRANHLSLVHEGRCGPRCAVGDSASSGRKKMSRQTSADTKEPRKITRATITRDLAETRRMMDGLLRLASRKRAVTRDENLSTETDPSWLGAQWMRSGGGVVSEPTIGAKRILKLDGPASAFWIQSGADGVWLVQAVDLEGSGDNGRTKIPATPTGDRVLDRARRIQAQRDAGARWAEARNAAAQNKWGR